MILVNVVRVDWHSTMSNLSDTLTQLKKALEAPLSEENVQYLFSGCELDVIKLFFKRDQIPENQFALLAVKYSNVEALQWAFKKGFRADPSALIKALPEKEDLDIIEFLCKSHRYVEDDLQLAIAQDKPLLVARILQQLERPWSHDLTIRALKAGAFQLLKSIYTIDQFKSFPMIGVAAPVGLRGAVGPSGAVDKAALISPKGRPPQEWAPEEDDSDSDFSEEDLDDYLAETRKSIPESVQDWVKVNGVPTPLNAFEAASRGRLDVLQWFFPGAKGCGLKTWRMAFRNDHIDILHWLHQSRPENVDFNKEQILRKARKLKRQDILAAYKGQ